MINGEGTHGNFSEVASPDPFDEFSPWQGQKLDGDDASPASSQYSSCGESEFDRYCSANSVMGTPSICSTSFGTFSECIDSEFGSVRSLGLGEDSVLENFSLGGGFDGNYETRKLSYSNGSGCVVDRRIEFRKGNVDNKPEMKNGLNLFGNEQSFEGLDCLEPGMKFGSNLYGDEESSASREVNHGVSGEMISSKFESGSELLRDANLNTDLDKGVDGGDDKGGHTACRGDRESGGERSFLQNLCTHEITNSDSVKGSLFDDRVNNGSHFLPWVEEGSQSNVVDEVGESGFQGLNLQSALQFDGKAVGRLSEEETLSRYEHSEDEDSMFDYGTDNEHKIDSPHGRNIQCFREEKTVFGNPLLMNSTTAFGSEDWDNFVQETGEGSLASVMFNKFEEQKQMNLECERILPNSSSATPIEFQSMGGPEQGEDVGGIHEASVQVQGAPESVEYVERCSVTPIGCPRFSEQGGGDARGIHVASNQVRDADELIVCESCSASNIFQTEQDPQTQKGPLRIGVNVMDGGREREHQYITTEKVIGLNGNQVIESQELGNSELKLDPLSDVTISKHFPSSTEAPKDTKAKFFEDQIPNLLPSMPEDNIWRILNDYSVSADLFEDHPSPIKMENFDLIESYDEVVNEMEEILLDSGESPGARFTQDNRMFQSYLPLPLRDGSSTASTSDSDHAHSLIQHPLIIDGVEVVGAMQKRGDVSLGERLVGVKEYTVYKIRVWSGKDQWEVERRYRDFFTLYQRLKTLFADQGWILPSPWSSVQRESRKIFGNASPDVVAERSVLIQECLRSILHARVSSSPPRALIWFLTPQNAFASCPASNIPLPQFTSLNRAVETENVSTLGKTISLVVEIRAYKSTKQLLEAQHYTCAGCHRRFDCGKTLMRDFVQTFGWGKPRLCEYTSQLFCSLCHTNDTAVLPARVLHHWDFTQYPVSQMAKSYLDSIHDQPMLCVSAVNPFLFSKVPALLHVMNVRKKIGAMLSYVRCSFRRSINKGLGSRRYLLESNDFFALRDLIDLSKGAFAVLPVMAETVSRKILEHITEQCLICCDVGVPCGARQACNDPSSLIFPFQEGDVERCRSCKSVFHRPCFRKLTNCPCGAQLRVDEAVEHSKRVTRWGGGEEDGALDLLGKKLASGLPGRLFSGLFSKAKQENVGGHKDGDTVILMGSLPSTSL